MRPPTEPAQPSLDLKQVHTALAKTTEVLAAELGNPGAVAPEWSDMEWQIAKAVSAIHGVSGLLFQNLRWRGPDHWHAFLAVQNGQVAARLPRIEALLELIDSGTRQSNVPCVALKGAALLARGVYAPGERPMADVDLLVREQDAPRAAAVLEAIGFRAGVVTWKHRVFNPINASGTSTRLGENSLEDIKIEVHEAIRETLPLRPVQITRLVFPARAHAGINEYSTPAALLLHVLLHASGTMIFRALRLLHLNDIHRLTRGMSGADWEEVFRLAAGTDDPSLWWAYPPLALTDRYFGGIPAAVLERLGAGSPWLLRRLYRRRTLSQLSLSYLWVSAFPGIEWAQSLGEVCAYAAQRIVPNRQTVALRAAHAVAQPQVDGGQWAATAQARRIVRWLVARQPRQATLEPVRAVLLP